MARYKPGMSLPATTSTTLNVSPTIFKLALVFLTDWIVDEHIVLHILFTDDSNILVDI
jgi:hypothetical protein